MIKDLVTYSKNEVPEKKKKTFISVKSECKLRNEYLIFLNVAKYNAAIATIFYSEYNKLVIIIPYLIVE